jgi:alanine racemase
MRCRLIVDLDALRSNYARLGALTGGKAVILCVVKANAYGHGALPISRALVAAGARHLGVATLDEAVELRDGGVGASITVLCGLEPGEEREAALRGIEPAIGSFGQLARWSETGSALARRLSCHLLFNTGMNRLGIDFNPARKASRARLLDALSANDWADPRGVATHYASAEDFRTRQTDRQTRLFARQLAVLRDAALAPRYVHAGNSAAIVHRGIGGPRDRYGHSMVRPGLALYGYVKEPSGRKSVKHHRFRPALEWRARVAGIRHVPAGAKLGYGGTFVAPGPMRVGIVSVGYADGFNWRLSNRGWVTLRGKRCDILGEVSMDLTLVDLSGSADAREGDEVVLLGCAPYGAPGMADLTGGMAYEVLCGISCRVPRQYGERASGPRRA